MMFGPKLTKDELGELRGINALVRAERYKLTLVVNARKEVPGANTWIRTQEALITLLERKSREVVTAAAKRLHLSGTVQVDISNGKIWTQH